MSIFLSNTKHGRFLCYKNDYSYSDYYSKGVIPEHNLIDNVLPMFIKNSKYIVDIGANYGCHCISYSRINSESKIIAFEPQSKIYDLLLKNIKLNNRENITVINKGVGHTIREARMEGYETDGMNAFQPLEYGTDKKFNIGGLAVGSTGESIQMITLDSMELEGCDFIKCDIEGFEPLAFMGAEQTIRKYKPVICFEYLDFKLITDNMRSFYNIPKEQKDSFQILQELDYFIFRANSILNERVQVACNGDWIAIHKDDLIKYKPLVVKRLLAMGDVLSVEPLIRQLHLTRKNIWLYTYQNYVDVHKTNPHVEKIITSLPTDVDYDLFETDTSNPIWLTLPIWEAYIVTGLGIDPIKEGIDTKYRLYLKDNEKMDLGEGIWIVVDTGYRTGRQFYHRDDWNNLFVKLKNLGLNIALIGNVIDDEYQHYDKDFRCKTTVRELIHIINGADYFIGIESGPLHFARILRKRGVGMYDAYEANKKPFDDTKIVPYQCDCYSHLEKNNRWSFMKCNKKNFDYEEVFKLFVENIAN